MLQAQLRYQKAMFLPCEQGRVGFSLAWPLAFIRSLSWLVCRVVDLFMPLEKVEKVSHEIKTHENPAKFFLVNSHVFHRFFRRF